MILLSGHSLTPARKVPVEALSLQLKERDSSATMTPADMTGIGINSWFRDETEPGANIVWRAKSISQAYATDTPTVQLEHMINSLRDRIMFGEVTPATITGNKKATTCTAEQAVRYILRQQSDWVLGTFGYSVSNPYKFDGDSLFDALETVTKSLTDAWWSYDMTVYPFKLNITRKDTGVSSEMRASRNIRTITKTIDKTGMYTRFYPIGKDDLHIDGDCVDKNTSVYGVVARVETDSSLDTKAELRRWANERLANHCEPVVTIDIEGLELADATGEPLDRLTLGRVCRVPLPEYGTTIQETITELSYPDKVHNPESVKITLANNREDVTHILSEAIRKSGRGGRAGARQSKEDHAWIEDTEDHVALCAESIIGRDPGGVNWQRFSTIVVDGEGIHQRVEKTADDVVVAFTRIEENEDAITLEAQRRVAGDGELNGKITVQADRITQEVTYRKAGDEQLAGRITVEANRITQEVTNRTNADNQLSGRITVEANRITQEVTRAQGAESTLSGRLTITENAITQEVTDRTNADNALSGRITVNSNKVAIVVEEKNGQNVVKTASIVTAINNSESTIRLDADKVYIGNTKSTTVIDGKLNASDVTAQYINGKIGEITSVGMLNATVSGELYVQNSGGQSTSVRTMYNSVEKTTSGNDITLKFTRLNGQSYASDSVTFSRAVVSWTMGWSNGIFTVTANPQGQSCNTNIVQGTASWSGRTVTIPIEAIDSDNPNVQYATGRSVTATYAGDPHTVTSFDTTAPSGATYNGLTNNSDGYVVSGNNAYIVTKSTWNCDGNAREHLSYLQGAPTALYRKGKSDGRDSYDKSVTLTYKGSVDGVYTYTTSTYVSGLSTNSRYTMHFDT